jgi:imidazole glycerol-phosphate synthase subunit HisH
MTTKVAIVDLGIGNFGSMAKMLARVGVASQRITEPSQLASASHVILPGVGAFDYAVEQMDAGGWRGPLNDLFSSASVPVLCVCVGMQLLMEGSDEGQRAGLGWINGRCRRFETGDSGLKVPHMGWNDIRPLTPCAITDPHGEQERFYFVHSYYCDCEDGSDVVATTRYGIEFASIVRRGCVTGVQFHPEKSHAFGMGLLRRFTESSAA